MARYTLVMQTPMNDYPIFIFENGVWEKKVALRTIDQVTTQCANAATLLNRIEGAEELLKKDIKKEDSSIGKTKESSKNPSRKDISLSIQYQATEKLKQTSIIYQGSILIPELKMKTPSEISQEDKKFLTIVNSFLGDMRCPEFATFFWSRIDKMNPLYSLLISLDFSKRCPDSIINQISRYRCYRMIATIRDEYIQNKYALHLSGQEKKMIEEGFSREEVLAYRSYTEELPDEMPQFHEEEEKPLGKVYSHVTLKI